MTKTVALLVLSSALAACAPTTTNVATADSNNPTADSNTPTANMTKTPKQLAIGAFNALFRDYSEAGLRDVFAPDIV